MGQSLSAGIEVLTGHSADTDEFWCTRDSTTRQKLTSAFANGKTVTACIAGDSKSEKKAKRNGLVGDHAYTVVAYNSNTDQVRLRNPWGRNPTFASGGDNNFFLGKNDPDNPTHANNGYFWMNLSDFTKQFAEICYEE